MNRDTGRIGEGLARPASPAPALLGDGQPALPRCAPIETGRPDPRVAQAAATDPDPGAHSPDVIDLVTVVCVNCGRPHCATLEALTRRPVCPFCHETVRQAATEGRAA